MSDGYIGAARFGTEQFISRPDLAVSREACGKIIVRGSARQLKAATAACGLGFPTPNTQTLGSGLQCLWQRPQRVLVLCEPYRQAGLVGQFNSGGAIALAAESQYCAYRIAGLSAADLLNMGCSLDLRNGSFPINACAGTLIAKVPATLLRADAAEYLVLVESALAEHFEQWLAVAADAVPEGVPK